MRAKTGPARPPPIIAIVVFIGGEVMLGVLEVSEGCWGRWVDGRMKCVGKDEVAVEGTR